NDLSPALCLVRARSPLPLQIQTTTRSPTVSLRNDRFRVGAILRALRLAGLALAITYWGSHGSERYSQASGSHNRRERRYRRGDLAAVCQRRLPHRSGREAPAASRG